MACQLSRPALAMRGRRSLQSLRLRNFLPAPLPRTLLGEGRDGGLHYRERPPAVLPVILAWALLLPLAAQADNTVGKGIPPPKHKWTSFVQVKSQPEPVPAEWVSTPEGQFAHSIEIPNPVPKDSGYRWWWSAKKYFLHLCETEAGEFVFKTADNVEGFLFMRPPKRPTDFDLKDRYKLEAPSFERMFRPYKDNVRARGRGFVSPGRDFLYLEEPNTDRETKRKNYLKATEYDDRTLELSNVEILEEPTSRYAVTWRGLRRPKDREHGISGTEVIVLDWRTNEIVGVWREFGMTGRNREEWDGVWWLNAAICPQFYQKYARPDFQQKYGFISSVLHPPKPASSPRKEP